MGKVSFYVEEWQDHRHRRDQCSSPPSIGVGVNGGANYIQHNVSKFDTLAGVAIKYGVEVAHIKRLNGLVTDLQMFGLKTLQIPLPGRHPPSPSLSNGHDHDTPQRPTSSGTPQFTRRHSDLFLSFQSLKSSSTSPGYNGLTEKSNPLPRLHRRSKSTSNCFVPEEVKTNNSSNFSNRTPETLLKEENACANPISVVTGKSLALRPKSVGRVVSGAAGDNLADANDGANGVRKSCSTSNLQDSDNGVLSSIWSLKPDFQALTNAAITRPIFDGLPKPVNKRNKAALD